MTDLAHPHDLAGIIRDHWHLVHEEAVALGGGQAELADFCAASATTWEGEPPPREALTELLAMCFQASLLREEQRPVTFRLILADPDHFPCEQGPPDGLHCLPFLQTRPLNPLELRRLSPAADFYRSLLGVSWSEDGGLRIWGIIHSGLRWLQNIYGGRGRTQKLPPALVVSVTAPGRLTVGFGSRVVARLEGGQLSGPSLNAFESHWLPAAFAEVRTEILATHAAARAASGQPWAQLDGQVIRNVARYLIKRLISALRSAQHGATILILPTALERDCCGPNAFIDVKYRFAPGEPRQRFRTLILGIAQRLAESHGATLGEDGMVGWQEYSDSNDEKLTALDEAIYEMAYLIAGCAEVDGAVVLTKRFELLGFGGEISGALPGVPTVREALDLEGARYEEESTESVGTRHRSAYRFCRAVPEAVVIIVSQDGAVRFVKGAEDGAVTYWDQSSTTSLDV
ncbi:MAG: DNA integrity scanning protein DisA nucleotide-binding domain protein [Verrucomicrobia bacterium]|nr:DNA integrity scanning protein DisA nucleotide-binding domain protein [Verrucomicrobiota bacterium]